MITGRSCSSPIAARSPFASFRAAADLGMEQHRRSIRPTTRQPAYEKADAAIALPGRGVAAYLDGDAIIARRARDAAPTAIHPGYGFLSENADFARRCAEAGITFVGPDARDPRPASATSTGRGSLPREVGVPTLPGTAAPDDPRRGPGVPGGARRRRRRDGQGGCRRRRPRHAPGARATASWRRPSPAAARRQPRPSVIGRSLRRAAHAARRATSRCR